MGTFRLSKSFIDYTVTSITSQAGGFVKENLLLRDRPKKAWRSTDTSEQVIEIDLLAAREDPELHIEDANFETVQLIGSDDGDTFDGFDTGELTIEKDKKQGIYRYGAELTGFNHRYVKVVIKNQATTDGESFFRLGVLSFMSSTSLMATNPRMPLGYVEASNDGHLIHEYESGGMDIYDLAGGIPLNIELNIRQPFRDGSSPLIWEMFRRKSDVVYINFGLGESWQAYLVRRVSAIRERRDTFSHLTFDTLEVAIVS